MWRWFGIGGLIYVILLFTLGIMTLRNGHGVDVLLRDLLPAALALRRVHATDQKRVRLTLRLGVVVALSCASAPDPRVYGRPSTKIERRMGMCRWLAYSGSPVRIEDLIYKPEHSLIDQSLHSKLGAETTNGDGFGIGWYGVGETPGVFHSVEPAWNDWNLRELAGHLQSPVVFAHIRASSGTPVQQTNCHPFRRGRWLWMHNGLIGDFHRVKRDLVLRVDPELYPEIQGSSDSEIFFFLALTFGLEDDPPGAVEQAVGLIEAIGRRARSRAPDPDDRRDDRRPTRLGVPVLERGEVAVALLLDGREHASPHAPGAPRAGRALGRVAADRLGAAPRPRGGLERGSRVELRRDPGRTGRDEAVHPRGRRSRRP